MDACGPVCVYSELLKKILRKKLRATMFILILTNITIQEGFLQELLRVFKNILDKKFIRWFRNTVQIILTILLPSYSKNFILPPLMLNAPSNFITF